MTNNTPAPFFWGEIELSETLFVENVPHVTRTSVGEWLGYSEPRKAISKILERNLHIKHYSTVVSLTTVDGKNRQVSVYHPIGFMLIVMESGQPKAQAMKVAVAEFVWHFVGSRQLSFKEHMELMKLQRSLFNDLAKTKDAFTQQGLTECLNRVCLQLGQAMPDLHYLGKDAKQLELEGV